MTADKDWRAINRANWDWSQVDQNPFWSPDAASVPVFEQFLDEKRKSGSSAGAIVEIVASGIPAGLGAPVYDKLDADLAKAMMSINATKAVEIGAGFDAALLGGVQHSPARRAGAGAQGVSLVQRQPQSSKSPVQEGS